MGQDILTFSNLVSFLTAFKKFKSPYDKIQHSALYSWRANNIEIFVPENEVGVRIACQGYSNVKFVPNVKRARELGFPNQSPIVRDMIEKSFPYITTPMVALINSDIIILPDFSERFEKIVKKYGYDIYMVGTRYDIKLNSYIDSEKNYEKVLKEERKFYDVSTSSDIFITSKFMWRKIVHEMPEFILGRYGWDNWLHMIAEIKGFRKFNCTEALITLHCQHDHQHIILQEKAQKQSAPRSLPETLSFAACVGQACVHTPHFVQFSLSIFTLTKLNLSIIHETKPKGQTKWQNGR